MAQTKFDSGKYDFVGKGKYILPIWLILMVIGMIVIATKGFNYGIDFAGGTEIQLRFEKEVDVEKLRKAVADAGYHDASVQTFGGDKEYLVRVNDSGAGKPAGEKRAPNAEATGTVPAATPGTTSAGTLADSKTVPAATLDATVPAAAAAGATTAQVKQVGASIAESVNAAFADNAHEIRRVESVGPQVGDELKRNSILAAFYSLLIILIYVGLRFDFKYAPGAVFCLLHDAIVMVAIYSVFNHEVNVQTLAAILTLMGIALNATIILYDRIRENEAEFPNEDFEQVVNKAHNDILSRTILTAFTMELSVVALYLLSDGVVQQIAYTLGIGILLGAFSSTYIAGTIVIEIDRWQKRAAAARLRGATARGS